MAKEYKRGEKYYLPVTISSIAPGYQYPVELMFADCDERDTTDTVRIADEPELLLTAEEVADNIDLITRATLEEYREGAVRRIQELETECEKWKATAQNCENSAKAADNAADNLRLENKKLKAERDNWKKIAEKWSGDAYKDKEAYHNEICARCEDEKTELEFEVRQQKNLVDELKASNAELKARNAELEALLKEVTATRDEAVRQINELLTENSKLKSDCNDWKKTANERLSAMQMLSTDRNKLIGSNAELKEWYDEANKTASEAAEANDELKAKIAELRAENERLKAELDQRNHDILEMKKVRDRLLEENEKWKAKYDNLSAINREQGLRIGDLDKKVAELEGENTNLNFLLEAQPEKETTKTLHVTLNDGTEIEFRRYTGYQYRTDINVFVVKDGEKYVAGFLCGDKPGNLAYWWTE